MSMAPGLNGGGRPTGTVPKTKAHNETSREQHPSQPHLRDFSYNHMNNNLAPADWQSLADFLPPARSRKESNNSSLRYPEPNEIQDEAAVCAENQWFEPSVLQPQTKYCSDDEVNTQQYQFPKEQARWEDKRRKSNNIMNLPDQTQMNRRLFQICDYINQSSNLMDPLQPSSMSAAENGLPETIFSQGAALVASPPETLQQKHFSIQPTGSVPKSTDSTLRRNELKMKMEESQRKVLELREQSAIMALKQKAQEQLKEAHTAQRAWLAAAASSQNQATSTTALSDANMQDTLNNLQRSFYSGRNEIGEMFTCSSDCSSEVLQLQNKLKELQLKKSQMDQKILQYASFNSNFEPCELGNITNGSGVHAGDHQHIEDKIAELAALKEQLNRMQGVISTIPSLNNTQESEADETISLTTQQGKQDNRTQAVSHASPGPSSAMSSANLQAKSMRLREARARLHHLQELLNFVEKLRDSGKPVPEKILALLNNVSGFSDEDCVPFMDMSENCFQDLYQEVAAAVTGEKQRQPLKPNNTSAKIRSRTQQLEDWMKKDDLMSSINTDINSQAGFVYQETPTSATWGGSTHGTLEDHNTRTPDYSSDGETENEVAYLPIMNKASSAPASHKESASCTNIARDAGIDSVSMSGVNSASSVIQPPQNTWGKQSSGSGTSLPHGIWTPSSSLQAQAQAPNRPDLAGSSEEGGPNPDNRWIAQVILQMQAQLQHVCQNVTEKHQNNAAMNTSGNMWMPPFYPQNGPGLAAAAAAAGYNQFVVSQQQQMPINQLLVNSLNQCCSMIWHQQCELMAVKETMHLVQQQLHHQHHHHHHQQQQQQQQQHLIEPSTSDLATASGGCDHLNATDSNLQRSNLDRVVMTSSALPPPLPAQTPSSPPHSVMSLAHAPTHYFYAQAPPPPPYGNNLNFESSGGVGVGALNNQVPPGNRANNYWDNFRSYSRQNLLSVRSKTNEGLLTGERGRVHDPNVAQSQHNYQQHQHHHQHQHHQMPTYPPVDVMTFNLSENHKEKLNTHQSLSSEPTSHAPVAIDQPVRCARSSQAFHQNNCLEQTAHSESISKGACKKIRTEKSKEQAAATGGGGEPTSSMIRSWNSLDESGSASKGRRHLRNTASTEDLPRNSNFKRKADCKINPIRPDYNCENMDSLEEAFYSEVAALISVNERQINYLLQLFRDLKHLNSDSDRQAALITIHNLATRACASQQAACCAKEPQQIETICQEEVQEASSYQEAHPRTSTVNCKESAALHNVSNSCSKPDWERMRAIRSVSVAMLPFLKARFDVICGPSLLEEIRNCVLLLIPPQYRQEQLITSLEGALLKFQDCRLRDACEELLSVIGDVLMNDVTFHRFVASMNNNNNNTNIINNNNNNDHNGDILLEECVEGDTSGGREGVGGGGGGRGRIGEEEVEEVGEEEEEEEEEGAVGGIASVQVSKPDNDDDSSSMLPISRPLVTNQMVRCNKSDAVSEADLAEADQSRLPSGGLLALARACPNRPNVNGEAENITPVQDRREPFLMEETDHHNLSASHQSAEIERGLDQVPVQLNAGLELHDGGLEHPLAYCSNANSDVNQM